MSGGAIESERASKRERKGEACVGEQSGEFTTGRGKTHARECEPTSLRSAPSFSSDARSAHLDADDVSGEGHADARDVWVV